MDGELKTGRKKMKVKKNEWEGRHKKGKRESALQQRENPWNLCSWPFDWAVLVCEVIVNGVLCTLCCSATHDSQRAWIYFATTGIYLHSQLVGPPIGQLQHWATSLASLHGIKLMRLIYYKRLLSVKITNFAHLAQHKAYRSIPAEIHSCVEETKRRKHWA